MLRRLLIEGVLCLNSKPSTYWGIVRNEGVFCRVQGFGFRVRKENVNLVYYGGSRGIILHPYLPPGGKSGSNLEKRHLSGSLNSEYPL